ncbi:MAG: MlaD family protein [Gemmatimonadaceae bacterium]
MARPQSWRDLTPGVITLAVLVLGSLAVLRYARVGALHGDTIGLVVLAGDAGDLARGSEVWLAGQKIGVIDLIDFREPGTDSAYRLRIDLSIRAEAQPLLRRDSRARIARGGSLLGASVLALSVGTAAAPPLLAGDTIHAVGSRAPATTLADGLAAVRQPVAELRDNVVGISREFGARNGTVGAAMRGEATVEARRLAGSLDVLLGHPAGGDGSLGLALRDVELRRRVSRTAARADSLRLLLNGDVGSIGRFRRDSTLARQIAGVRDEVSILRALVNTPTGTVGRARADGAIAAGLADLESELTALTEDIKQRPLRYLVF